MRLTEDERSLVRELIDQKCHDLRDDEECYMEFTSRVASLEDKIAKDSNRSAPSPFRVGDTVEWTIRDLRPGDNPPIIGTIVCEVVAVDIEACLAPKDWDETCDLLAMEGSMSWTEIRDVRSVGHLDNVQIDDDLKLVGREYTIEEQHARQMFSNALESFKNAAHFLERAWDDVPGDVLGDTYPQSFRHGGSFDELIFEIDGMEIQR